MRCALLTVLQTSQPSVPLLEIIADFLFGAADHFAVHVIVLRFIRFNPAFDESDQATVFLAGIRSFQILSPQGSSMSKENKPAHRYPE